MATIHEQLAAHNPTNATKYDPGKIVILFDNRISKTPDDKFSRFQSAWTEGLYRLGWPSLYTPDLNPGELRLVWYTHKGNQGHRDFPLHKAYAVKEMFDSLSSEGFRPMVLGYSAENPFPMIGGVEPPPEEKKAKLPMPKKATSWSANVSGHRVGETPWQRVMAIIGEEERREAEGRRKVAEGLEGEKGEKEMLSPV